MNAMQRRTILRGALGGALGSMVAAPMIVRGALGDTPVHSMKLGYADVANSPYRGVLEEFADTIRNGTNGAVDIKVYPTGALGSQANIMSAMQIGAVDFVAHYNGFIQTLFPKFTILDFPYLFADRKAAETVIDGKLGEELFADLPTKGILGLSWIHWGWRPISTVNRPVPTPADIRGLRIRLPPGAIYAAIYKSLGALPVSIDVSEIYVALAQGAVDSIEVPLISLVAGKYYEVAKIVNLNSAIYNAGCLMASKKRFEALDPQFQEVVRRAARDLSTKWRDKNVQLTEEAAALVTASGCRILQVDDEAYRTATRPVYDQFRTTLGTEFIDFVLKQAGRA